MQLTGIHHLTAVTADVKENYRFYTQTMGMRLVKRSVNQDDVSAYHLFYADAVGTPGTDLTFFDWNIPPEQRGTHSITRTFLRVKGTASLEWWKERFQKEGVTSGSIEEHDGRSTLFFDDSEGQRLALIEDNGAGQDPTPWDESPVPAEHQIRGLGPVLMSVPNIRPTHAVLTEVMNLRQSREYSHAGSPEHTIVVYEMGEGGAHAELHVAIQPGLPFARLGAGGVHHVAFRTPDEDEYHGWHERLNSLGIQNSGKVDRFYFRSLYFREPNGILFEIATDGPGFTVDEDPETLGENVVLPPFLEPNREEIVANLKPIE